MKACGQVGFDGGKSPVIGVEGDLLIAEFFEPVEYNGIEQGAQAASSM